jgi:hypothetical protein
MPVRKVGSTPATCPASIGVGSNAFCKFKLGMPSRVVLKKKNGANPFALAANVIDETVWDALLALTIDPDNVYYSPQIYNATLTAGTANIIESEGTGTKRVTHYTDSMVAMDWDELDTEAENELIATIRDNASNLEFIYVNTKGQIVTSQDVAGNPTWIPVNIATITARGKEAGRGSLEMFKGEFHIYEENDVNWKAYTPAFNILAKTQS